MGRWFLFFSSRKRPASERTQHFESVQKATGGTTIWEFFGFQCGAIWAFTDSFSTPHCLNAGRAAAKRPIPVIISLAGVESVSLPNRRAAVTAEAALPSVAHHGLAGVRAGDIGEFA